LDVASLVTQHKQVGLANLHVVNLAPSGPVPVRLRIFAPAESATSRSLLRLPSFDPPHLELSMLLSKAMSRRVQRTPVKGLTRARLATAEVGRLRRHWLQEEARPENSWNELAKTYDMAQRYRVNRRMRGVDLPLRLGPVGSDEVLLLARGVAAPQDDEPVRFSVQQMTTGGRLVGGSTFVFKPAKR